MKINPIGHLVKTNPIQTQSNPIQSQLKPKQSQLKPKQTQYKPKQTQFQRLKKCCEDRQLPVCPDMFHRCAFGHMHQTANRQAFLSLNRNTTGAFKLFKLPRFQSTTISRLSLRMGSDLAILLPARSNTSTKISPKSDLALTCKSLPTSLSGFVRIWPPSNDA